MGATHFLTKGLDHVSTEMSLHVLAYNFRRLIAILGFADMIKAIRAFICWHGLKAALWLISLGIHTKRARNENRAEQFVLALQS